MSQPDLATLERVKSIVRHFLPRWFDTEAIAVDIMIESWSNDFVEPSWSFIHQRCIDKLREQSRETKAMQEHQAGLDQWRKLHDEDDDLQERGRSEVSSLVKVLSLRERRLIHYRFYLDLPLHEIARRMEVSVNNVREGLAAALYKMRQEVEQ